MKKTIKDFINFYLEGCNAFGHQLKNAGYAFLMLLMMSTTNMYAEDSNIISNDNIHITVNAERLANTLNANEDQTDAICTMMDIFDKQTECISTEQNKDIRSKMLKNAIDDNLKLMSSILSHEQMKEYKKLLNVTLINRGLNDNF